MTARLAVVAALLAAAGCGTAPKPVMLVEGYCPANEAPRCFYDHPPMDGF